MMLSRPSPFLLAVCVVAVVTSAEPFAPTRQCHQEFARVSVAQVEEVANLFISRLSNSEAVASLARDNLFNKIQYDVVLSKVCGSCSSVFKDSSTFVPDATTTLKDKESYCFPGAYGYDATHSSLVMTALDPDTNQIVTGETRGLLYVSKK
jgi:hypothetical protein